MKKIYKIALISVFTAVSAIGTGIYLHTAEATTQEHVGRCTGSKKCTACKNCTACMHCHQKGGKCGVCSK